MKAFIEQIHTRFNEMTTYSKKTMHLGLGIAVTLYIFAGIMYIVAPYMKDYFKFLSYYRFAMEAAPACLAACVCGAIICDIIYHKENSLDNKRK